MTKQELARRIYEVSHLTGEFKLRSGQVSYEYFDKYLFESTPELLNNISKLMAELVPNGTEVIAGLEMGGIPIATAISLYNGKPVAFVRKKAKEYGTCKLAEGCDISGKNVCIVEDVVTTGGQIIESVNELRKAGAKIDTVICVIQRDENAIGNLAQTGLKLFHLFNMEFIKSHL
ncbi:MAG: orotate phosphoribosyltransferase [Syntrophomonas sp.]